MSAAGDALFHDDGCVRANIQTRPYRLIYAATCEHTTVRFAEIVIMSTSPEAALDHGQRWLRLPQMRISHAVAVRGRAPRVVRA